MTSSSVFRPGGVSYLRIPAPDTAAPAGFCHAVSGWRILTRSGAGAPGDYSSIPDIEKTELVRMSAGSMRMRSSLLRLSSGSEASR